MSVVICTSPRCRRAAPDSRGARAHEAGGGEGWGGVIRGYHVISRRSKENVFQRTPQGDGVIYWGGGEVASARPREGECAMPFLRVWAPGWEESSRSVRPSIGWLPRMPPAAGPFHGLLPRETRTHLEPSFGRKKSRNKELVVIGRGGQIVAYFHPGIHCGEESLMAGLALL